MPISQLPSETVRALGSSQVIVDSVSVVKELVDNALDASACSVFVEISLNSLDIIQVKDNGYGIAPADRQLVCKRYCTSKIEVYNDIQTIGGRSLGFRGEALSSVADMSGSLMITTKAEGDPTAVSIRFSRSGQIDSEERTSHPVGTTVKVRDFLKFVPVRHQNALRTSGRTLLRLKALLQDYALIRPSIRFTLKVLKAKNDKGNWSYVPKLTATTFDAVAQIYSKSLLNGLVVVHWPKLQTTGTVSRAQVDEGPLHEMRMEAILPLASCDHESTSRTGQHFFVDGRPVSNARGTFKQIAIKYKEYLRAATRVEAHGSLSDPFLCMKLSCPTNSYDINVEPAKDDVLFSESGKILELVEQLFEEFYGHLPESLGSNQTSVVKPSVKDDILLYMNMKHSTGRFDVAEATPSETASGEKAVEDGDHLQQRQSPIFKGLGREMAPTDGRFRGPNEQAGSLDEESELRGVHLSNPWTMAKMNAPIRQHKSSLQKTLPLTPGQEDGRTLNGGRFIDSVSDGVATRSLSSSPQRSLMRSDSLTEGSSSPVPFPYPLSARRRRQVDTPLSPDETDDTPSPSVLDAWIQRSSAPSATEARPRLHGSAEHSPLFVSAANLSSGTAVSDIPLAPPARRRKSSPQKKDDLHREIVDSERIWFGRAPHAPSYSSNSRAAPQDNLGSTASAAPIRVAGQKPEVLSSAETCVIHPDLALTLDYERRKADAMQKHRLHMKQLQKNIGLTETAQNGAVSALLSPPSSSPQKHSVYRSQDKRTEAPPGMTENLADTEHDISEEAYSSVFQAHDTRLHLIQSLAEPGIQTLGKAMQNQRLPLETMSRAAESTRDLVQEVHADKLMRSEVLTLTGRSDPYMSNTADMITGFPSMSRTFVAEECSEKWAMALMKLLDVSTSNALHVHLRYDIDAALAQKTEG